MEVRSPSKLSCLLTSLFLLAASAGFLMGQGPTGNGTLHCTVTDPSGAAVTDATVLVTSDSGKTSAAQAAKDGSYVLTGLPAGTYKVQVIAKGFAMFERQGVVLSAGQVEKLNVPLSIEVQQEKVEVKAEAAQVSVRAENNASALVISEKIWMLCPTIPMNLKRTSKPWRDPLPVPTAGRSTSTGLQGANCRPNPQSAKSA